MQLSRLRPSLLLAIEKSRTPIYPLFTILLCISACTPIVHDPNKGRIINPESLAIIGPVIIETDTDLASQDKALLAIEDDVSKFEQPQTEEELTSKQIKTANTSPISRPVALKKPVIQKLPAPTNPQSKPRLAASTVTTPKMPTGVITGNVSIRGDAAKTISSSGVILTLIPIGDQAKTHTEPPVTHSVDMANKTYQPGLLTIKTNDRISFLNKDKIKHNVFSSSGKNSFDLGTYSAGMRREVSLRSNGLVKVYCNIHADMAIFIEVSDDGLSTITDNNGNFHMDQLKEGQYLLKTWHIRGEKTQVIDIKNNQNITVNISLDTANYTREKHSNKFGKKYDINIFDDEFY